MREVPVFPPVFDFAVMGRGFVGMGSLLR